MRLEQIQGGWAAVSDGWAVFGPSEEEAHAALRRPSASIRRSARGRSRRAHPERMQRPDRHERFQGATAAPRPEEDGQNDSPFERFESLTKRLVAVPKKEIDRKTKAQPRRKDSGAK